MAYSVGMVSLGCSKNRIDAEIMLNLLNDGGFELTQAAEGADIVIINTCGFIEDAKKEAIDTILEYASLKKHGMIRSIVVTGCLAERYGEQILSELPEVDAVVSIGANMDIASICRRSLEEEHIFAGGKKDDLPLDGARIVTTPPYTAYIKIADGCDNRCSYCAIPGIRGRFRSRRIENIVKEAGGLASNGAKELIVIAQDTTRYGKDIYGEYRLPELLEELSKVEGIEWIRIMYCYPECVTDRLLDVMASNDKIVKYMDLPIQHCSGRVLRNMHRRGDREYLLGVLKRIRDRVDGIALRTTVMTGFPGETEEDFEQLERFVEEAQFDRLGCFAFSPEEGTPAAEMEGQIEDEVKIKRQEIIMTRQMEVSERKLAAIEGETLRVLAEGFDGEQSLWYGRSYMDAPEIDGRVYFSSDRDHVTAGEFVNVEITGHTEYDLIGREV